MKRLLTILLAGCCIATSSFAVDEGFDETGPHVRVVRHDDGSRSIFKKLPNQKGMQKRMYSADGILISITQYATGKWGQLTGCKIYDSNKNEIYKVAYGYDKYTARLLEERMFDSKTNLLLRRFIYTYDAAGNRSKPLCINIRKDVAEEYKKKVTEKVGAEEYNKMIMGPSMPEKDPFADDPSRATPGITPIAPDKPAPKSK